MHAGRDGGRVEDELKEKRNEVDRDEDGGAATGGGHEEENHRPRLEEFAGKDAAGFGCQYRESLLETEDDEEYARGTEKTDDLSTSPGVGDPTEVYGHHSRDHGSKD